MDIDKLYLRKIVLDSLEEDIGDRDITCEITIPHDLKGKGRFIAKEDGVLAGFFVVETVLSFLDPEAKIYQKIPEGEPFRKGDVIGEVIGNFSGLLSGERTMLNFVQHLSGIATKTNNYVQMISETSTKLLDTRKTTPGLRNLEKYAVKMGGGYNHRIGLFDMILIKENHITMYDGIESCLKHVFDKKPDLPIEIEVKNFDELKTALQYPLTRIMLDNFTIEEIDQALKIREEMNVNIPFEASGNINEKNILSYALTGVEYISSGSLTHSVNNVDITFLLEQSE